MPQFSLKRMFVAVTLVAAGIAIDAYFWRHEPVRVPTQAAGFLFAVVLFLPGFLLGAGLFSLGRRVQMGILIGIACGFVGLLVQIAIIEAHRNIIIYR